MPFHATCMTICAAEHMLMSYDASVLYMETQRDFVSKLHTSQLRAYVHICSSAALKPGLMLQECHGAPEHGC